MPKKIVDLRDKLLCHARNVLVENKCADLTIRSAASACHVAVGTVYNYFPSKEVLIEAVVLEDWAILIEKLRAELQTVPDAMTGLETICSELKQFAITYDDLLCIPVNRLEASDAFRKRHNIFVDALCELLEPLLLRFDRVFHPILPLFLAEALLVLATDPDKHFDSVRLIFQKLLD